MVSASYVFLVGAGPGDPELLTIKARGLLNKAEVVVYDRLVSDEILALIPPGGRPDQRRQATSVSSRATD